MKNNKVILGFVGDLAGGKGTVAKYLSEKYKVNAYRFSTILRDMIHRLYMQESRDSLQKLSTFVRETFGQDVLSKVIAKDAENDANDLVVVEGIRRPSDITYLQSNPGFHLVYITADPKIRWERQVKRNENAGDAEKTFDQFMQDETAEAENMTKELAKTAEYTVNNSGTTEELYRQIDEIVRKTKSE